MFEYVYCYFQRWIQQQPWIQRRQRQLWWTEHLGNQGMMNGRRSSNEGQGYGAAQQNGPSRWDALAGPAPGGNNNRWDNRSDRPQ